MYNSIVRTHMSNLAFSVWYALVMVELKHINECVRSMVNPLSNKAV
jgi:hypothetical protein